jgi:hypothetical protein
MIDGSRWMLPGARIASPDAKLHRPRLTYLTHLRHLTSLAYRYLASVFTVVLLLMMATRPIMAAGTWIPVTHPAPGAVVLMLLLPDGTVMTANIPYSGIGKAWYKLTPDSHGSYANGTWTTLSSMHDTRLWYSSQVLQNGHVLVAGGEYGTGGNRAEFYDPLTDTWTATGPPVSGQRLFYDSVSKLLPNGNVLVCPVVASSSGGTTIYDVPSNTWKNGPKLFRGFYQDEASWVKLPDDSILTIDPFGTSTERFIPSMNQWVNDTPVPVDMYDPYGGELGAAFLLADGRAFYLGGTGHTLFYTPTGNASPGSWTVGPDIPNGLAPDDAGAAMMVNGKILCAAAPPIYVDSSGNNVFPSPTSFFEFDPVANAFTTINGPTGPTVNSPCYLVLMLDLPDGTVLYSHFDSQLYIYRPDGSPLAAGKPTITSITQNQDGSYHMVGTLLNGISEGAAYGDDAQMNSNFPLIRLTDSAGHVYYARSHDWSSTGVMTGSQPLTTEFNLPPNLPVGVYSLVVTANGISSDPVTFSLIKLAITAQPQGLHVLQGTTVDFSVAATGVPPLGYQWQLNGAALSGATNSSLVLANTTPGQSGTYSVVVSDASGSVTSSNDPLVVVPTVPLPVALDNSRFNWLVNPSFPWYGQTNVSYDGTNSGRSYFIGDNQETSLITITNGPGTLSFWWRVSSQTNADLFTFSAYGTNFGATNQISGEVDWTKQTFYVPPGQQTFQWTYTKDASLSAGLDAGFVDQVTYVLGAVPPLILTQPASQSVFPAQPVTFTVVAGGTAPLAYQWRLNGSAVPNATSSSLTLSDPSPFDAGAYTVTVTNAYGSTNSATAMLAIVPLLATGDDSLAQIQVPPNLARAVRVAAGSWHSLILQADGSVTAFGDNSAGQTNIPANLVKVLTVAAGGYHSLALQADGTVVAWGDNTYGQASVPSNLSNVVAIAAGVWHSVALRADGTVVAWGLDSSGQRTVPEGLTQVVTIAAGGAHSLALRADGSVVAWGDNTGADGGFAGQSIVPFGLSNVVAIAAGDYHSLAVTADGSLVAWGDDANGQCDVPQGLSGVVAVAGGGEHTVALKADDTIAAWGNNWNGQCDLPPGVSNVVQVAAGNSHTLVLVANPFMGASLLHPARKNGHFSLSLQTFTGRNYALEYKNSLSLPAWSNVLTARGFGTVQSLTDTNAAGPQRFYRVRQF